MRKTDRNNLSFSTNTLLCKKKSFFYRVRYNIFNAVEYLEHRYGKLFKLDHESSHRRIQTSREKLLLKHSFVLFCYLDLSKIYFSLFLSECVISA